jgi:hypothetical protein
VDRTAVIALCPGGWLLPGLADAMRGVAIEIFFIDGPLGGFGALGLVDPE